MSIQTLVIPVLTSRSWWRWVIATGLALLGGVGWVFATQPQHRVGAVVGLVLFLVGVTGVAWSSTVLERAPAAVVRSRCGHRRRVLLQPSTSASLVPNGGGVILLALRPVGARRRMFVPLFSVTDNLEASQGEPVLRALADALEGTQTGGSRDAVLALRAQAEHVGRGGDPRTSPLAQRLTFGALNAAKGAGGAGSAAHLPW